MRVMLHHVRAERRTRQLAPLETLRRLVKTARQHRLVRRRVNISNVCGRRLDPTLYARQSRRDNRRIGKIRIHVRSRNPALDPQTRPAPTTRNPAVRLSGDHAIAVGAQLPAWNRL